MIARYVCLFVYLFVWNGLSLERRRMWSGRRKRKEKKKKSLGNFNFGDAAVVYPEL